MLTYAGAAFAADALSLPASEPATIYYTTNGATPVIPDAGITTSATSTVSLSATPANYYMAQGATIIPPAESLPGEVISLVPDAGRKGKHYIKPQKLKIHESKAEFERHVKEKHGKRYKVMDFDAKQSESGLEGYIYIVENKNSEILQLGETCTEEERVKRITVVKEFILSNPELIGLFENEELRVRSIYREGCEDLYFDRYVNGYEFVGATLHFVFVPQFNYSVGTSLKPINPEMYAAAQADALPPEEIVKIVYRDMNISIDGSLGSQSPKLRMHKYLRDTEPYAVWRVEGRYVHEINAISGEIINKRRNVAF